MPIHLHTVCGYFELKWQSWVAETETVCSKLLLSGPLQKKKKIFQALSREILIIVGKICLNWLSEVF